MKESKSLFNFKNIYKARKIYQKKRSKNLISRQNFSRKISIEFENDCELCFEMMDKASENDGRSLDLIN